MTKVYILPRRGIKHSTRSRDLNYIQSCIYLVNTTEYGLHEDIYSYMYIDCLKVVFIMSEYKGRVGISHRKCTDSVFFLRFLFSIVL